MERFKNILLFVDSNTWSKEVCGRAITLAAEEKARLTILDVIEAVPRPDASPKDIHDIGIVERCEQLKKLVLPQQLDPQVEINVVCGNPFVEVMQQVLRGRHDLVMVADEGNMSEKETSVTRATWQLLGKCPCPLWVIRPGLPNPSPRIMAAVDPDPLNADRNALNPKILEITSALAGSMGVELSIVNASTAPAEGVLRSRAGLMVKEVSSYMSEVLKDQRYLVEELLQNSSVKTLKPRVHFLKGEAAKVIPLLVLRERIDLLIVGMLSRADSSKRLIGNTAERILRVVNCSVLAIKP